MLKKGYLSFLALIFSLALMLGVTACNSDDTSSEPEIDPPTNVEEPAVEEPEPEPEPALEDPEAYKLTTAEWMKLYHSGDAAVVVDLRRPDEIEVNGKFANSININNDDIKANPAIISEKLGELGVDKDATVLVHCFVGGRAGAAIEIFQGQGYTSTYALAERTYFTEEGEFRYGLTLPEWDTLYSSGNAAVVVDLRRPDEIEANGKLADSININNDDIKANPAIISQRLEELGVDKDATVLVHCALGGRAGAAIEIFQAQGYTSTFALLDRTYFTEDGKFRYGLNPTEWDQLYTSGNAAVVIDARTPAELEADGKLSDSVNINNDDIKANPAVLSERLEELEVKKTDLVLTHCKLGGRAAAVNEQLHEQGYKYAFYLAHALVYPEEGSYEYPDWDLN